MTDKEEPVGRGRPPARFNGMTERLLLSNGYLCDCTESYNMYSGHSKDFLNFADFIAVSRASSDGRIPGVMVAIQVTSSSNVASRRRKIYDSIEAYHWMLGGGRIWIISWKRTLGKWWPVREFIHIDNFPAEFHLKFEEYWRLRIECAKQDIRNHPTKAGTIEL